MKEHMRNISGKMMGWIDRSIFQDLSADENAERYNRAISLLIITAYVLLLISFNVHFSLFKMLLIFTSPLVSIAHAWRAKKRGFDETTMKFSVLAIFMTIAVLILFSIQMLLVLIVIAHI